jgi:hypothetical protein
LCGLHGKTPRVWITTNERIVPECVAEHNRLGGGSVLVWTGISAQAKTDPHIIDNGTLMADVHVRTYAGAVGPDCILMYINARAHRAHITNRYLEEATLVRMDWQARSLDLNQIDYAKYMLQKAISSRHVQPTTVQLRHAIIEGPRFLITRFAGSSSACDVRP